MRWFKSYLGEVILLAASMMWGTAFMFQSLGNDAMQPFTFVTMRSIIATLVMGTVILIRGNFNPKKHWRQLGSPKGYRIAFFAGIALSVAMILQQVGLVGTTSGKAGFLTSLYILFVPLLGFFVAKKPSKLVWLGLTGALIGFYFMSMNGEANFNLNLSDMLIIGCAIAYAFQIFFVDRVGQQLDSLMFSFIQFFVASIITSIPMFIIEGVNLDFLSSSQAIYALLYVGIVSSCIAYTFQIMGQKRVKSAPVATLIMSLESVFALLAGMLFLNEGLSLFQAIGMVFILSSIILVNLPWDKFFERISK